MVQVLQILMSMLRRSSSLLFLQRLVSLLMILNS
nr:MAG TPA: hypothetical protein [Bacteriophage sp.]